MVRWVSPDIWLFKKEVIFYNFKVFPWGHQKSLKWKWRKCSHNLLPCTKCNKNNFAGTQMHFLCIKCNKSTISGIYMKCPELDLLRKTLLICKKLPFLKWSHDRTDQTYHNHPGWSIPRTMRYLSRLGIRLTLSRPYCRWCSERRALTSWVDRGCLPFLTQPVYVAGPPRVGQWTVFLPQFCCSFTVRILIDNFRFSPKISFDFISDLGTFFFRREL